MLIEALNERGHEITRVDVRDTAFDLGAPPAELADVDIVINRVLSMSQGLYATRILTSLGVHVINPPDIVQTCADKVATSLALERAGIPTPQTVVAFTIESALEGIESVGYPCVLKPVIGSWGRLVAKVDSFDAAEGILEHKATLGNYEHNIFYIQDYVPTGGEDIRVLTLDGHPIAAMSRQGAGWRANAALGASVEARHIDGDLAELATAASDAVGGGMLGVDLLETETGYTVHEVNHGVEFRALNDAVDLDVPGTIAEWIEEKAAQETVVAKS